jgi:hypothetical protein
MARRHAQAFLMDPFEPSAEHAASFLAERALRLPKSY